MAFQALGKRKRALADFAKAASLAPKDKTIRRANSKAQAEEAER